MSSAVATMITHSSKDSYSGQPDPLMLLYRTSYVSTPDVANVVFLINDLRNMARHMEPRLAKLLLEDVKSFDYALASLTSVHGKGLNYLTTETKSFNLTERKIGGGTKKVSDLVEGYEKRQQPGIPIPDND